MPEDSRGIDRNITAQGAPVKKAQIKPAHHFTKPKLSP